MKLGYFVSNTGHTAAFHFSQTPCLMKEGNKNTQKIVSLLLSPAFSLSLYLARSQGDEMKSSRFHKRCFSPVVCLRDFIISSHRRLAGPKAWTCSSSPPTTVSSAAPQGLVMWNEGLAPEHVDVRVPVSTNLYSTSVMQTQGQHASSQPPPHHPSYIPHSWQMQTHTVYLNSATAKEIVLWRPRSFADRSALMNTDVNPS